MLLLRAYLIAAIAMNLSVLEGHLPIVSFISQVRFLARRSMIEALMLRAFRVDHLSVRTCEQWPRP